MKTDFKKKPGFILAVLFIFSISAFAQDTNPPDEPIRISTEEVHLNITAQTVSGRFVPTLTKDDLLIVEEGAPQKIESMKKVPASVLLLLDTGGNLNFAKSLDASRLISKVLVQKLSAENSIAVLQSYDKIETVSDWTQNQAAVQDTLDKKLFSGNRSRFSDSVNTAVEMFKSRPLENRHLIFIGDALDSLATQEDRRRAFANLLAANITIHVLAYNKIEAESAKGAIRNFQFGEKVQTPRVPDFVLEQIIAALPKDSRDGFRRFATARRIFIIRLDKQARTLAKQKREDWIKSEGELQSLAEDTGGFFQAPEVLETMWLAAAEIAQAIDSQYVVTYIPTKPFAGSQDSEERKVRVSTHCDGVQIRARQKVVLVPKKTK